MPGGGDGATAAALHMLGHASLTEELLPHSKLSSPRAANCAHSSWSSCVLRLLPLAASPSAWRSGDEGSAAADAAVNITNITTAVPQRSAAWDLARHMFNPSQVRGKANRVAAPAANRAVVAAVPFPGTVSVLREEAPSRRRPVEK